MIAQISQDALLISIITGLLTLLGVIVGWIINRTLKNLETVGQDTNVKVSKLHDEVNDRPNFDKVKEISKDKAKSLIKDHKLECANFSSRHPIIAPDTPGGD